MRICGHTFDDTLMPERPVVLDVGARDFGFTNGIIERWPSARVVAVEPDPDVKAPEWMDGVRWRFINAALVGDGRTESGYAQYSTGEGNFLTEAKSYYDARMLRVLCTNIRDLMNAVGFHHWDLVKLDCEGSEFQILQRWPGPIATQITCEFHDYHDAAKYNADFYAALFARLPWYEVRQHKSFSLSPGQPPGHWDSLLVRR